jgi:hypothetical protein
MYQIFCQKKMCCDVVFNISFKYIPKRRFVFSQSYNTINTQRIRIRHIKIYVPETSVSKNMFSLQKSCSVRDIILQNSLRRTIQMPDESVQAFSSVN